MDSPWKLNSDNVSNRDFHQQYINTIYKALQKDKNTDTLILKSGYMINQKIKKEN